jgi:hypothetical protein
VTAITTDCEAASLADITSADWAIVARAKLSEGRKQHPASYRWIWCGSLGGDDAVAFRNAVDSGVVLTVQGRLADGSAVLYAKLAAGCVRI